MRKKVRMIGIALIIMVALIGLFFCFQKTSPVPMPEEFFNAQTDVQSQVENMDMMLPDETKVIIHGATFTASGLQTEEPRSAFYFYDEKGNLIKQTVYGEEINSDFMVQSEEGLCLFFKNDTMLIAEDEVQVQENTSGTKLKSAKFGPSAVGFIEDLKLNYALLNIGKKSPEVPYINILRFVSGEENYDVIIPYYLEQISYDSVRKQFICEISPLNGIEDSSFFDYVLVSYDEDAKQFVYDATVHHIDNPHVQENWTKYNSAAMTQNNQLYHVIVADTMESADAYVGHLILSVYDLETDKTVSAEMLLENYDLGIYGGVVVGSSHLPVTVRNGKMYIFPSNGQVFIVDGEKQVEKLEMPHIFKDAISLWAPEYTEYQNRGDFQESNICVGEDGEIYILSLFKDGYLRINHLLAEGRYELYWEGKMPAQWDQELIINSFEILSD